MRPRERVLWVALALWFGWGCRVGPRYKRPAVDVPPTYRSEPRDTAGPASVGDAKWSEVFGDQELQKLIARALDANYDVQIAAARILQARAQLTIVRADQFPNVSANAEANRQRAPARKQGG